MCSRLGKEIPDEEVYIIHSYPFAIPFPAETSYTKKFRASNFPYYRFNLGSDGLWATILARNFWQTYPHMYPHITLFEILHKNLEI